MQTNVQVFEANIISQGVPTLKSQYTEEATIK